MLQHCGENEKLTDGCSSALRICSRLTVGDENVSGGGCHTLPHLWLSGGMALLTVNVLDPSLAMVQRWSVLASFQVFIGASLWVWCFSVQNLGMDFCYCCLSFSPSASDPSQYISLVLFTTFFADLVTFRS